jgi:hypothetical protein
VENQHTTAPGALRSAQPFPLRDKSAILKHPMKDTIEFSAGFWVTGSRIIQVWHMNCSLTYWLADVRGVEKSKKLVDL